MHIVQKLQSDQGSTSSSTSQPRSQGEETLKHCAAPLRSPPPPPLLPGCAQQERALKLSAVSFMSSDHFLKQQHKVLVWFSGNLKLWRQNCPPPPRRLPRTPALRNPDPARRETTGQPTRAESEPFSDAGGTRSEQNTLGEETGRENPVTVRGGRREADRRCKKGGRWEEEREKFLFAQKSTGAGW